MYSKTYLAKSLGFCVLLETKCWEMYAGPEDLSFSQYAYASNAINLHLHVGIAIRVPEVCQMGPPRCVLGVSFDDNGVFVQGVG